jgi:hypothetical protein
MTAHQQAGTDVHSCGPFCERQECVAARGTTPVDWRVAVDDADPEALEPFYSQWVGHLTKFRLHDKADIATALAIQSAAYAALYDELAAANDGHASVEQHLQSDLTAAREALEAKEREEWIPVSADTLPPNDTAIQVLALGVTGVQKVEHAVEVVGLFKDSLRYDETCYYTHWRPLPAPPSSSGSPERGV